MQQESPQSPAIPLDASVAQVISLAQDLQTQRKAEHRWKLIFRFITLGLVGLFFIGFFLTGPSEHGYDTYDQPHAALVRLEGPIMEGTPANAESVNEALREAFSNPAVNGVIIQANSPGGTPVQSAYIYDEIMRLKALHPEKKVYGVIGDLCASGCYYALAATDEIYANASSIVGSIGVRMESFGVTDLMQKIGVEQRLLTAGEHKAMLNPFGPEDAVAKKRLETLLADTHQAFISAVKEGRGERLANQADLFSGLVWSGQEAIKLGLTDALGDTGLVMREKLGNKKLVDYSYQPDFLDFLAKELGQGVTSGVLESLKQQTSSQWTWHY